MATRIEQIEEYLFGLYELRYNEVSNEIEKRIKKGKDKSELFEPFEYDSIRYELFKEGFKGFDGELSAILGHRKSVKPYNPFVEYFGKLELDDSKDYIEEFANHIRAENQKWFNLMFKKHLVRTVAVAVGEASFNKHCFTFYGRQNDGKTTLVRSLVPQQLKPYYSEDLEFQNKDGKIALCKNFIINLDELHNLAKQDVNECKTYFTKETVNVRPPFEKTTKQMRRRCSFFASTNNDEFLTDTTGNVRWLVFKIKSIDFKYSNLDVNKLWQQAYLLLKNGFTYSLTRDEIEFSEGENKSFMVQSVEMDFVEKYFEPTEKTGEFLTSSEVLERLSTYVPAIKFNANKIKSALEFLGFKRVQERYKSTGERCINPRYGYWIFDKFAYQNSQK